MITYHHNKNLKDTTGRGTIENNKKVLRTTLTTNGKNQVCKFRTANVCYKWKIKLLFSLSSIKLFFH